MAPPVIYIDRIPEEGLPLELVLDTAWLDEVLGTAELSTTPGGVGHASLRLDLSERNVYVSGRFEAPVQATCVACLDPVTIDLRADITLHLEPAATAKPGRGPHEEVELTRDELDVDVYTEDRIDLAHWLREAILLEAPLHPRHEVCPTLIAMPTPQSAHDTIDPRLAPLARFLKKE